MVRARGGGTDNLPPAGSRRHRRSAIDAERLWWEIGNSSSGSGSGSSGSGGRRRRKCSWLLLLFVFPVTFFVVFAFATLSSMHDEPSNASKDGISLTARAARHWAASVNSSSSRQRRQATSPLSQPSPPPPLSPLVASPAPTLSPVLTDGAQCARPPSAEAAVDVTMVTQASAERLWMIPHICARWGGRMIVVTLRQPGEPPVAWPAMDVGGVGTAANASSRCALLRLSVDAPAAAPEGTAMTSKSAAGGGSVSGYPINWMRNVGIRCVATSHYLVVDVDFWPSEELLGALREQLHSRAVDEASTALVVPNFQRSGRGCRTAESANACREAFGRGEIEMPTSFAALRSCLDAGDCGVFDGEYTPQGQASTDVKAWLRLGTGATRRVPCITSERYEPFVSLQRTEATPIFDERFSGYGKNKVQLVVHLRRAGYAFEVLGRGFVMHFPHKASASKHHWLHSSAAHGRVDRLFVTFGREVQARYAGIAARTPLCSDSSGEAHARLGAAGGGGGGTAGGGTGGGTGGGAGGKAPRKSVQQRLNEERRRRELALNGSTHGKLETRVEHEEK